jgi:pimeloyl-ACP methyl ester carboxylesterase
MNRAPRHNTSANETIVLVHGLWMHGVAFSWMARQLRKKGYKVKLFSYRSVLRTPQENADRLARFIHTLSTPVVHLVGHSLGGIVLMHLLDRQVLLKPGRVVLLGTPICGSQVARNMSALPFMRSLLLGKSVYHGLLGGVPHFSGQRELGVVAGDLHYGIGRLFSFAKQSNDGTVFVRETQVPKARDSIELSVTHTSMVFSKEVVAQVVHFLDCGCFRHDPK